MPVFEPAARTAEMPASASHKPAQNSCSLRTVLLGVVRMRLHLLRLHVFGIELQYLCALVVDRGDSVKHRHRGGSLASW